MTFNGKWFDTQIITAFKNACLLFVNDDDDHFNNFKQHPDFCAVIGNDFAPQITSDKYYIDLFIGQIPPNKFGGLR